MLLKELVENNRVSFHKSFPTWEEAIIASCQPLLRDGTIEGAYVESIIESVNKFGPYIVFAPDIAMPHSQKGGVGVNGTAISFMKVEQPVQFLADDREKDARLFFAVCATEEELHLQNMELLANLLMTSQEIINELLEAKNREDLLAIDAKYSI